MPPAEHNRFAAGARDAAALDSLFAREMPRLVAFVRARAGGVVAARESAHDLAQSVCREALADLPREEFADEDAFRRWLFARAVRKICNRYRFHHRARRDAQREIEVPEGDACNVLDAYATLSTPSRNASAREEVQRFETALLALPDDQREAIALTRVAGFSYSDAAEQLGRSESAVRGLVMRGLTRLSALLGPADGDS